jgi:hypothetical protein
MGVSQFRMSFVGIMTSEQARELAQRPRITEAEEGQMISLFADGYSVADVASQFPQYAAGTIANRKTGWKAQIDDLRRARAVPFKDIPGVRKPARVNDYWELRTAYRMLFRTHLESCYATNPETGEKEFVEQLVDARKLKVYSDAILKANRAIAEELGQLPQAAPGLPQNASHYNLVGSSNLHLVDQGGDYTPRSVSVGRKLTQAEKDARAQPALDYWDAVTDELRKRLADLREGRDPGPRSPTLDAAFGVSVEERADWRASNALSLERLVGGAEDEFAEPEPEPEPEPVPVPVPEPVSVGPLEPAPGPDTEDGEWVWVDD